MWFWEAMVWVLVMLVAVAGVACFTPGSAQEVVASIAARRIGHMVAQSNPALAKEGVIVMGVVLTTGSERAAVGMVAEYLGKVLGDEMLAADLTSLLGLLKYEGPTPTSIQVAQAKAIATAFIQGAKMGGVK